MLASSAPARRARPVVGGIDPVMIGSLLRW
jgi:hypothetical protein